MTFYTISKYSGSYDGEPDLDIGPDFNSPEDLIDYAKSKDLEPASWYYVTKWEDDSTPISDSQLDEFIKDNS